MAKGGATRRHKTKPVRGARYAARERGVRPWGVWEVLAVDSAYVVKRLTIKPGQRISLQFHRRRSENWIIAEGRARVQVGEAVTTMKAGASVHVPRRVLHRLTNVGRNPLVIIEVQRGTLLDERDIVRLDDDHGR